MKELNLKKTQNLLRRVMEFELAGVVRYTHYALMITGPHRIPIVQFMKQQAAESLLHAQQVGELLTGLGGHPSLSIAPMDESFDHSVRGILEESRVHERAALKLYKELLETVQNRSIYLEEFTRQQIATEEMHGLELAKMLRDIGVSAAHHHDEPQSVDQKLKAHVEGLRAPPSPTLAQAMKTKAQKEKARAQPKPAKRR